MDVSKFFDNIDRNILFNIIKRKVSDKDFLDFTEKLLSSSKMYDKKEGISIPPFKALIKLDDYLRKFIFEGGFDIEISDEK